jgi:hypothetical protein
MTKDIVLWYKRVFKVIHIEECIALELKFVGNIYGDEINALNCRSIWVDNRGRRYRCHELGNYTD